MPNGVDVRFVDFCDLSLVLAVPFGFYGNMGVLSILHLHTRTMEGAFKVKYSQKLSDRSALAPNGQCLVWRGTTRSSHGTLYGVLCCKVHDQWKTEYVHRLALIFHKGWTLEDVADRGLDVSHLCHNPLCVRPEHLSYEPHWVNRNRTKCVSLNICQKHADHLDCMLGLRM
jgi:hypothetical protein